MSNEMTNNVDQCNVAKFLPPPERRQIVVGPLTEMTAEQRSHAVAVGVSRTEEFLQKNLVKIQQEMKRIEKLIAVKTKALEISVCGGTVADKDGRLNLLNAALSGIPATYTAKTFAKCDIAERIVHVTIQLVPNIKGTEKRQDVGLTIYTAEVPFNTWQQHAANELQELTTRLAYLAEGALEWKRKLADMNVVERKAKAALAELELSQSDEGRMLLAKLESNLLVNVEGLLLLE